MAPPARPSCLSPPKSLAVGLFGAVEGDHPAQQPVIHVPVPRDAEQHFALGIAGPGDFPGKALHSRPLRRNGQVSGGGAEPDDERAMIREHGLVPRDPGLQAGKRPPHPLQHLRHAGAVLRHFHLHQIFRKGFQSVRPFTSKDQK